MNNRECSLKTCKHFTGIMYRKCDEGIAYKDVRRTDCQPYRFACLPDGADIHCASREYPTAQEVDVKEEAIALRLRNILTARKAIDKHTSGRRGVQGKMTCPVCGTGTLSYSVAGYNGHIHAQCSTPECVAWLE